MITVEVSQDIVTVTDNSTTISLSSDSQVISISDNRPTISITNNKSVVEVSENTSVISIANAGTQGPPGPTGSPGNGAAISHSFSWGDATPATILTAPAGKLIYEVRVVILTAFNAAPLLSIGDVDNNSRLFSVDNLDSTAEGTYQSTKSHVYLSPTDIKLFLTIGSETSAGNGIILIYIQG